MRIKVKSLAIYILLLLLAFLPDPSDLLDFGGPFLELGLIVVYNMIARRD